MNKKTQNKFILLLIIMNVYIIMTKSNITNIKLNSLVLTWIMMLNLSSMYAFNPIHPMNLTKLLMIHSLLSTLMMSNESKLFIYSYMMFMIFMTGINIMFLYISSIIPQFKNSFNKKNELIMMITLMTLINYMIHYMNLNKFIFKFNNNINLLYENNNMMMMITLTLFITLTFFNIWMMMKKKNNNLRKIM